MAVQLEAILANFAGLQKLDDDTVKLVAYNIVCMEYGKERLADGGSGTMLITESMSASDFVSFLIADYLKQESRRDPKTLSKMEPSSLAVHFSVVRRWPRRDPKFDEKRVDALGGVLDALRLKARPKEEGHS